MIQSREPEDALYKLLEREHEFNDPRWPFLIKVREVKGRNLIDATFRHRSVAKNNEYDAVIQSRSAILRVDVDAKTVRVFFEEPVVQHLARSADVVLMKKNTLEMPTPGGSPLEAERTLPKPAGAK